MHISNTHANIHIKMLLGEERLSYIALVKVNKNSDRRFSITNLSCVQVEPGHPLALCAFLSTLPPPVPCSPSAFWLRDTSFQLPAPITICTARYSAYPLLTRYLFCSVEKPCLLLFGRLYSHPALPFHCHLLLCCPNKFSLTTLSPVHFSPMGSHRAISMF